MLCYCMVVKSKGAQGTTLKYMSLRWCNVLNIPTYTYTCVRPIHYCRLMTGSSPTTACKLFFSKLPGLNSLISTIGNLGKSFDSSSLLHKSSVRSSEAQSKASSILELRRSSLPILESILSIVLSIVCSFFFDPCQSINKIFAMVFEFFYHIADFSRKTLFPFVFFIPNFL